MREFEECNRTPLLIDPVWQNIVQCNTCPDSSNCARLLEEKWRQAYLAVFRFGKSGDKNMLLIIRSSWINW